MAVVAVQTAALQTPAVIVVFGPTDTPALDPIQRVSALGTEATAALHGRGQMARLGHRSGRPPGELGCPGARPFETPASLSRVIDQATGRGEQRMRRDRLDEAEVGFSPGLLGDFGDVGRAEQDERNVPRVGPRAEAMNEVRAGRLAIESERG